jgi:hypothetical protein
VANPNWDIAQVHNEMMRLEREQGNISWRTINGVPTEIKFTDDWESWTVFDSSAVVPPTSIPVPAPTPAPTQNEKSTNQQIQQLLSDDHRLGISSRPEPAAPPAEPKSDIELLLENERAALDLQDAAASRRWNRAMGLSPAFQPGGFKGDD